MALSRAILVKLFFSILTYCCYSFSNWILLFSYSPSSSAIGLFGLTISGFDRMLDAGCMIKLLMKVALGFRLIAAGLAAKSLAG